MGIHSENEHIVFTVALIGGDGAGKTTVANCILQSCDLPMKYVYMGFSTRSSNYALPTSRLVLAIKRIMYRNGRKKSPSPVSDDIPADQLEYSEQAHGRFWNTARFLNRTAEAWFRQLIVINHLLHGYVVIFDRHFYFDSAPVMIDQNKPVLPFSDRLFFWFINHWYPKPALTIFLDAPVEVLYRRKVEATMDYLQKQRTAYLAQGEKLAHFIKVDACQPLEEVVAQTAQHINDFYSHAARSHRASAHKKALGQNDPEKGELY